MCKFFRKIFCRLQVVFITLNRAFLTASLEVGSGQRPGLRLADSSGLTLEGTAGRQMPFLLSRRHFQGKPGGKAVRWTVEYRSTASFAGRGYAAKAT